MTDPIADMITQIRNGVLASKEEISLPYSKFKHELGKLLVAQGWLEEVGVASDPKAKRLRIRLKFVNSRPVISGLKRLSSPGQRIYARAGSIPRTQGGFGATIISTSKGLYTDRQARKENLGGELICQIW